MQLIAVAMMTGNVTTKYNARESKAISSCSVTCGRLMIIYEVFARNLYPYKCCHPWSCLGEEAQSLITW